MTLYKTYDGCIGYKTENIGVFKKAHYNHGCSLKDVITGETHYYESDKYFKVVDSEVLEKTRLLKDVPLKDLKMALILLRENKAPTETIEKNESTTLERSCEPHLIKTLI